MILPIRDGIAILIKAFLKSYNFHTKKTGSENNT
ncbi:MAG: hypothetical protein ACI9MS_003347 [Glaciecola sp.]|jgi:hypothetical protein